MYSQFKYQTYHIFFGWWVYVRWGYLARGVIVQRVYVRGLYVRGVFVLEPIKYCNQFEIMLI